MVSQANFITAILIIIIVLSYCSSLSKTLGSNNKYSLNNKGMMKSNSKNQLKKCAKVSCSLDSSVKCDPCDCGDDDCDDCDNDCGCLNREKLFEHNKRLKKFKY